MPKTPLSATPEWTFSDSTATNNITTRDYFAAKALQGLLANANTTIRNSGLDEEVWREAGKLFAKASYFFADAMLAARGE